MSQARKRKHGALLLAAALIVCAIAARVASRYGYHMTLFSIVRAVIYIGLLTAWGISVRMRIIQAQVRRYLLAEAGLMLLWLILRTVKYSLNSMNAERLLWYGYYLPMLFVPVLAVLVALSLGRPENYCLPKWTQLLYLPSALLLLLVVTNDFHQLVFSFPTGVLSDADYNYGIGYYMVLAWIVLCAAAALVLILVKCRIPRSRYYLWLPVVPFVLALAYCAAYIEGVYWVWLLAGDLTVSLCLIITAIFESCIQCGLIQSNTGYDALFAASTVRARITDEHLQLRSVSAAADRPLSQVEMYCAAGGETVHLDEQTLLRGHPIHQGYVFWEEDIAELAAVTAQLEQTREELRDTGDVLKEESAQKARWLRLTEENRFYDMIERDTRTQVELLDEYLTQLRTAESEAQARRLLGKIVVVGTYIKRRSNLIFVAGQRGTVDAGELRLCLNESAANLALCGVDCKTAVTLDGALSPAQANAVYDLFEAAAELALDTLTSLLLFAEQEDGALRVNLSAACGEDLTALRGRFPSLSVSRDEDGLWYLTTVFPGKGASV